MDEKYILEKLEKLISIDSPTSFTDVCAEYVFKELESLGYKPAFTNKGGVLACLGGEDNGVLVCAHIDTLGAMVRRIKQNGRIMMHRIGGVNQNSIETSDVRIYTRDGKIYGGSVQLVDASVHANPAARDGTLRTWDNLEILLDEDVCSKDGAEALGIEKGCIVAFDPNFKITDSGYIKSRFLDDKLCVAILLGFAKHLKDDNARLGRKVCLYFSPGEEVGHGAGGVMPEGTTEVLALDMGCVGEATDGSEKKVSISCADLGGPYDYETTNNIISAAKRAGVDYSVDVYPNYSSDADEAAALYDVRHALFGPGIYASHGYERGHIDGMINTFRLLCAYLEE